MFSRLSPHQNLALVLALLLISTVLTFVGYNYLDPQLPQSMLAEIQNYPTHAAAINFGNVALAILAISSMLMFMQKNTGRMLFLVGIIILLAHDYLIGPTARNTYYTIFEDSSYTLLGVIVALVWSDPIKQLFSNHDFNLANLTYLRILCGLIFALFCVGVYWQGHGALPVDMKIFQDHSEQTNFFLTNDFRISVLFVLAISPPIALCFKLNIARYLFVVWVLVDIIGGGSDAHLGGLAYVADRLQMINDGIIVALIFCAPLKDQFIPLNFKKNIIRTMALSLYSPKIYQEAVKERTGTGFFYLLFATLILSTAAVLFLIANLPALNATNENYIQSQLPNFIVSHGELSIDRASPVTIYDTASNPVAIIDTSGKANNFQATSPTVRLLLTQKNVFILNGHLQKFSRAFARLPLSDGNYTNGEIMSKLKDYIYIYFLGANIRLALITAIFLYLLSCFFSLRPVFVFITKTIRGGRYNISRFGISQNNIPNYAEKLDATLSTLDYKARLRIIALASTRVLLVLSLFYAVRILNPALFLLALSLYLSGISFGVKANFET